MFAQISAVKIDAESGNLMENSHPVIRLYKQECNHCTCLEFPRNVVGILIHLFDFISDALNPAQSSVV